MLIDARIIPQDETLETEVCIAGAGPAGLTLARELAGTDFRVVLLESGGLDFDQNIQSLSQGESVDNHFDTLESQRCFQFGGTANFWKIRLGNNIIGVRYVPLDKVDFEKRDWLPYSGWPFDKSHLDPFYTRAQTLCQLGDFAYDAQAWSDAETPQLPFSGNVTTNMFQFGPRAVFTHESREAINQAKNINTYLHANLVEIETDDTAKNVTRLRVACLSGKEFWVCAKVVILATGGIETARLLLLSNKIQTTGLGNQHDLVGRFFMDHSLVNGGKLIPNNPEIFQKTALYDLRRVNDIPVMGKLTLAEEVMQREQLLNISTLLFPIPKLYQLKAANSLKTLLLSIHNPQVHQDILKHLKNIVFGLDYILPAAYGTMIKQQPFIPSLAWGGWSYIPDKEKRFAEFRLLQLAEQVPDPDNRITLTADRDRLGRQRVKLHWRWNEIDIEQIKRSQDILQQEIAYAGIGELQVERDGNLPKLIHPGLHHHMGTTRMHDHPQHGVVDRNCQVHGISNLFIASSSVFPTGGYANPTLTIVALAIRLADHLKTVMGS
ncbi:GMC oxidoreductase [Nodularia spumigena]|uniref:GMC oxidoreductase n=1 Tax=Nodularia spumigena TaxID=70799 RepID=UPI00232C2F9D|nr:GMC family oxidoreductase [Nodularia spumigena]MDB9319346.1 GMC family oxidoreductase [Nodularia spumigena CS-590/01A]MDB9324408.1 GMC family oxidoreductase [Nodularia spumigena CS-591/07A]MDB9326508.1 GMC family oxidoreductase [Nodularia spumigena CS-590/02]MDB9329637.1 GMC family oxidoreductase [Nodularia spumigena CS-591/04]MDB9335406.1 GMC family oxidoreductase [Nodularia spumigena CS-590/01]